MSRNKYVEQVQSPFLKRILACPIGGIAVHWFFQGLLGMDRSERIFKLGMDVLLAILFWLIIPLLLPISTGLFLWIIALLLAHSCNFVGLIASQGGHLSELMQLLHSFDGFDIFLATYHSLRDEDVKRIGRTYFFENIGTNIFRFLISFLWALKILVNEKPNVIVSTGAEIAIPFFILSRFFRIHSIFIEGYFRVEDLSRTGQIVYRLSDAFFVQWPGLVTKSRKKARYEGSVL